LRRRRASRAPCYSSPERGRHFRIHIRNEVTPPWERSFKERGTHASVFRWVYGSAAFLDNFVERLHQLKRSLAAHGEVKGNGETGAGEGEHASGRYRAELLEHYQERPHAGTCDEIEELLEGFQPRFWDNALVLKETLSAVQQVPLPNGI